MRIKLGYDRPQTMFVPEQPSTRNRYSADELWGPAMHEYRDPIKMADQELKKQLSKSPKPDIKVTRVYEIFH